MFALIDCNNFYASCERLFRPDLRNKPIVVLSSGDGCVIARSNEAKALGIHMGAPYFEIKSFCAQKGVHIFSSNFALYRDMSLRVMSIIEEAWEETEIYSIDEAFLDLSTMNAASRDGFCTDLQKKIMKCTGIPVSIGLGDSKTLAKVANHIAKKELKIPVFNITSQSHWLTKIDVGDVWGVGRQWCQQLKFQGIQTAYDLSRMDCNQLKKQYNSVMMRISMELQGTSFSGIDPSDKARKSILSSRSFHGMQTEFDVLTQALSAHCANVYEKLREQNSLTYSISVFLKTNRFRNDLPQYYQSASIRLSMPTDDIRLITQHAKECLKEIYKPGYQYKKVGIWLSDLTQNTKYQLDLFNQENEKIDKNSAEFLNIFDAINKRFGKDTVRLAAQGFNTSWDTQFKFKSPGYTTQWSELPRVKVGL